MDIKDLGGISKPLNKLITVCASGIGKILEPRQIRKKAEAKAYELTVMAEALAKSKNELGCNITYEKGDLKLVVDKSDINENTSNLITTAQTEVLKEDTSSEIEIFCNDMERRVYFKNLKKEKNIYNTLNFTMNELEGISDEEISDEKVDEDWIDRFFNTIEDINNEKLQVLWAKILAGEIKQPNRYSLRTLELLKNLSFNEAELFSRVANLAIQNANKTETFILSDTSVLLKFNISFLNIRTLQDLDLIHPNKLVYQVSANDKESRNHLFLGKELICVDQPKNIPYELNNYPFTTIGTELLNLVEREVNSDYSKELSLKVKKSNQSIRVFSNSSLKKDLTYDKNFDLEI